MVLRLHPAGRIEQGFRIGFHGDQANLRSRMRNMVSAMEHPVVVSEYLEGERSQKLAAWRKRRACRKRELLSLIGSLSHACKAVRAGRSFLRRLIDLSTTVKQLTRYIRLGPSARSDIEWWYQYCTAWNGISMMSVVNKARPEFNVSIVSDASGSWGCGALNDRDWFQLKWAGLG